MYFKVTVQLTAVTLTVDDRWKISVLRRDLKVVRDGDVRVPCDMLSQADVAEAANARLPRVAWLTRGMARSIVDDDRSRSCS